MKKPSARRSKHAKTPMNKRSPTAHRTLKQMREHNCSYGAKKSVMEKDRLGHRARRQMEKEGKVSKNDGKDVHHIKPSVRGGSEKRSNLAVASRRKNRGHGLSPGGTKKGTGRRS